MIDIDIHNHNSWNGMLNMIEDLCDGTVDVSYSLCDAGNIKIPSLEVRMDQPEIVMGPETEPFERGEVHHWKQGDVYLMDDQCVPKLHSEKKAWMLRSQGAAGAIYRTFYEMVKRLEDIKLKKEFAWCAVPIAPICDDVELTKEKEIILFSVGSIYTIWVRQTDEEIKKELAVAGSHGEIRIQNMKTANTWIAGKVDEKAVRKVY